MTPPPVVMDVRNPEELVGELGHISGVINIPVTQLASRLSELDAMRDQSIITVCKSGGRAQA